MKRKANKSVLKKTLLGGLVFLTSSVGLTIETGAVQPNHENIISCAMLNGSLVHSIYKKDNEYSAYVTFPTYTKTPTGDALKAAQEAFKNWDGTSPIPDATTVAVAIPVENSNIITFDKDRVVSRISVLESLFPEVKSGQNLPSGMGSLKLNFKKEDCTVFESEGLISARCETSAPTFMNNIQVNRIVLQMRNVKSIKLIPDPSNPAEMTLAQQNTVDANLTFLVGNKFYRSSFTYTPSGDESQCTIGKNSIPMYDN